MNEKNYIFIYWLLLLILGGSLSLPAVEPAEIFISPDGTNQYGGYLIETRLEDPQPWIQVEANIDSLILLFNPETTLPAIIDPQHVTVNHVVCNALQISGQRLSILSPVDLRNFLNGSATIRIEISTAARIKNPARSGNYKIGIYLVQANGERMTETRQSLSYQIIKSSSLTMPATVTPNPPLAGQTASQQIRFQTGSAGFLRAGSARLMIQFDENFQIPSGLISGVSVNSTAAIATGSQKTVVITTPVEVDNDNEVVVNFSGGSGIINPSNVTVSRLQVKTSAENKWVPSTSFFIGSPDSFTVACVKPVPHAANASAGYEIEILRGNYQNIGIGQDTLNLIFENNTGLPENISPALVHLLAGGYSTAVSEILIRRMKATNPDTIQLILPQEASETAKFILSIDQAAGILNPSEAGPYRLTVYSSRSSKSAVSNPYLIKSAETTVSQVSVKPSLHKTAEAANYEISFNLGRQGRLQPGKSKIYFAFDQDFKLESRNTSFDSTYLSCDTRAFLHVDPASLTIDREKNQIVITMPAGAENENRDQIRLHLNGGQIPPLKNPDRSGTYTLSVWTSAEPYPVYSSPFAIGGNSVSVDHLALSDSTVNSVAGYTVTFQTETVIQNSAADFIEIIFPEATILPASIPSSALLINGVEAASLEVYQATRVIRAAIQQFAIPAGETISMQILPESKIINPAVASKNQYRIQVNTSKDFIPVSSRPYQIWGKDKTVRIVSADIEPAITRVSNVMHHLDFITSENGRLRGGLPGGSSTITVSFDSATIVPNFIPSRFVKINQQQSASVDVLTPGPGGMLRLFLPADMIIENKSVASLIFEAGAALATSGKPGSFRMRVKTSSDTLFSIEDGRYVLGETKSLVVNSLNVSPADQNNMAAYTCRFSTGSTGTLIPGDRIQLKFPAYTFLPTTISRHDITINGITPDQQPTVHSDTLSIPVPFDIERMTPVTLLISREAGILNPAVSGNYQLEISTTAEPETHYSPTYLISPARSTIATLIVEAKQTTIGMASGYEVQFTTGAQGRLPAGQGSIILSFDPQTLLSPKPADYDSSYIIVDGRAERLATDRLTVSNHSLAFSVPENVFIGNQEAVTIILNSRKEPGPIRNPAVEGTYAMQVRTSVEKQPVTSTPYKISSVPAVSSVSVSLSPVIVNAETACTISFLVQKEIAAKDGTVTIKFPSNTLIPPEISRKMVGFAHGEQEDFKSLAQILSNPASGTVTLFVPERIPKGDWVRIAFNNQAGLANPSTPGNYRLKVSTSSQQIDGLSTPYTLGPSNTSIVNLSVEIAPNSPGQFGRSTWRFTTGMRGRLVSGKSQIGLLIPADSRFLNGLPALSKVTVNGLAAHELKIKPRSGTAPDTLLITVPANVTIGNSTDVTVIIDSTAGLKNVSTTAQRSYSAFTSVEQTPVNTLLSLPAQVTSFTSECKSGIIFLQWSSESVLEDAYWMIERKFLSALDYQSIQDGRRRVEETGPSFEALAYLQGQSFSSTQTVYTYVDSLVEIGAIYAYRLSDVDYEGKMNYHDIIYQEVKPPSDFILFPNSPNPFKTHTMISYSLPAEARVDLKIFNVVGQAVITLAEAIQPAGFYQLAWYGINETGQAVASGLYIVSFRTRALKSGKEFSKLMKIMLLR